MANSNPIRCNSAGYAVIFLTPGSSYDYVITAPANPAPGTPANVYYTCPNIEAVPTSSGAVDVQGTAGVALTAGNAVYLSDGSGGLSAGQWYKADADLTYASTLAGDVGFVVASLAAGETGAIRLIGQLDYTAASLTPGAKYYISATAGDITSSAPTNARLIGTAESASSILVRDSDPAVTLNYVAGAGYTPTLLPATNTGSKVALLAVTIGANVMADGDVLYVEMPSLIKNDKGTSGTVTWEFAWGATTAAGAAATWDDSSTEFMIPFIFKMQRVGSALWIRLNPDATGVALDDFSFPQINLTNIGRQLAVAMTPTFSSSASVEIRVTLSAADVTFYLKPQQANVYRVAKQ